MTDDQIKHMTERFLQWKLPADFHPDNGISCQRPNYGPNVQWEPVGTNLLSYAQAEAMVRHMLEGLPETATLLERQAETMERMTSALLQIDREANGNRKDKAGRVSKLARDALTAYQELTRG